jgi:predicted DNA-binding transcriptional regulator AlpA
MHSTETFEAPGAASSERFLRLADVCKITCLGKTWITDAVLERKRHGKGDFPLPVKIGAATCWLQSEVQAWMRARVEQSRSADPRHAA